MQCCGLKLARAQSSKAKTEVKQGENREGCPPVLPSCKIYWTLLPSRGLEYISGIIQVINHRFKTTCVCPCCRATTESTTANGDAIVGVCMYVPCIVQGVFLTFVLSAPDTQ